MILFVALGKSHNLLHSSISIRRATISCLAVVLEELVNTCKAHMERRKILMAPKSYLWGRALLVCPSYTIQLLLCHCDGYRRWWSMDKFKTYSKKCGWMLPKESKTTEKNGLTFFCSVCSTIYCGNFMVSESSLPAALQNRSELKKQPDGRWLVWPDPHVQSSFPPAEGNFQAKSEALVQSLVRLHTCN